MNSPEADTLAKRIINTWRLTPNLAEWRDYLDPLDHTLAITAFQRLRTDVDGHLSIARFHAEYRARIANRADAIDVDPPAVCVLCDGTGEVDAPTIYENVNGQSHPYTQVQPCLCTRGQAMRPVHARIIEWNGRH